MEDTSHKETKEHPGSKQGWHQGKTAGWPGDMAVRHITTLGQNAGPEGPWVFL